jgi:hypothetical protein
MHTGVTEFPGIHPVEVGGKKKIYLHGCKNNIKLMPSAVHTRLPIASVPAPFPTQNYAIKMSPAKDLCKK